MSSGLKEITDEKDLIIENLRKQLEQYKTKFEQFSYENLTKKIETLQKEISSKDQEILDLKNTTTSGGDGGDINTLRTKLIIIQSKLRQSDQKIQDLTSAKEELETKLKRAEKNAGNSEQIQILKRQLRQEMETSDKLRNQLARVPTGQNSTEIQQLRQQLENANRLLNQQGGGGLTEEQQAQFKHQIFERDQKISELESQLSQAAGVGAGPMATLRLQREINALKSQIQMLKKNEAAMKEKYDAAMRNQEFSADDGW